MNIDILKNFQKILFFRTFPYFQIENCLPEKIYNTLDREYEMFENFLKKIVLTMKTI